jgi:hypothetical protein
LSGKWALISLAHLAALLSIEPLRDLLARRRRAAST